MSRIAAAYLAACAAELDALKPGNVHRHAGGHGMTAADFETSARVSAPAIASTGARVGARVIAAVRATRRAVGQNTNLGIALLCAPLAVAAERGGNLRENLAAALRGLNARDARDVFAAIALANPGGLGEVAAGDVRTAPTMSLLDAMAAAAGRDSVARQYVTDFADVFETGLPLALRAASAVEAAEAVYLAFLARDPDSHVGRKYGLAAAQALRGEAARRIGEWSGLDAPARRAAMLRWDGELKARRLNPGTSADLTVATVFAAALTSTREEWLAASPQQ
ncbi:MAG: triphosphoribosyl-dephospho-CoA synthase [Pseudomonadota bacterium]|nr:triphosphoribosyl-dephospho-CoA synthase [Pseudomonadota bacterium]